MDKKIVLTKQAYIGIIAAAACAYKRECYGLLFGKETKKRIEIYASQRIRAKELFTGISDCEKDTEMTESIIKKFGIQIVGDFHSHTDYKGRGSYEYANTRPGSEDIADMRDYLPISLICSVNKSVQKSDCCYWGAYYIRQVIDTLKGRLSFKLRGFYEKHGKAMPLELILSKELEKSLVKIKRKAEFFKKKRKEREKQKSLATL